ncbi:hypothetical protein [Salipaludibacillus neizhouensis]|uniref:hypothetical protein n=1 Tax=Salipaludibacillus neizhouensis TaxID=885475 RepID=UPI00389A6BA5
MEDHHPPIIKPEVLEKVQQEMKHRENGRSSKKKYLHLAAFLNCFIVGNVETQ